MAYQPGEVDTETVLDDLVKQFADPMSFFRELIQNSIDAGSGEIDIRLEFERQSGEQGVMVAHIDDFGEGMSRDIIETKLTRLFSSGKDEDFTKIGRFGIGFVSVFAIEPQAVCVDTGRAGEYWRVLFHEDKQFDLISLDMPVEGTQIRVIKSMTQSEFEAFQRRTREVITYWCRYVQVPIYLDGEQLNEPFDVESLCKVTYEEEGTRIVAGFVEALNAPCGYYNRGLTLKEGEESPWPHVAIKIDSRYLEHTLTRDQVLQDKHFHKANRLMTQLAERTLPEHFAEALGRAANRATHEPEVYESMASLAYTLFRHTSSLASVERVACIPTLYGEPITLAEAKRLLSQGNLLWSPERTHLTDALMESVSILLCDGGSAMLKLVQAFCGRQVGLCSKAYFLPKPSSLGNAPGERALCSTFQSLCKHIGGAPVWVGFGHFRYTRSPLQQRMVWLTDQRAQPVAVRDVSELSRDALKARSCVVLNADLSDVTKLTRIAVREPEWAAYTLIKMILLHEELTAHDDMVLVTAAIELRTQRMRSARRL